MSEDTPAPEPSTYDPASAERATLLSAGALLRQAREASGLHIAALAVAMKVPVKKLEALESDRLDLLPDAVFVRALASAMCRALKMDPAPVLAKLPETQTPKLDTEARAINTPFHAAGEAAPMALPTLLRRPAALAVLALLVAALGVSLWPQSSDDGTSASEAPVALVAPASPEAVSANPPPANPVGPATPYQDAGAAKSSSEPVPAAASASPSSASVVSSPAPSVAPVPLGPVSPPAATAAAAVPAGEAIAKATNTPVPAVVPGKVAGTPQGSGVVTFRVKGASWIEVTDSQGVVQLRRTLQSGEAAEAGGALPLSVTVGKADVTTVEVRGRPFNLTDVSRDNVARFEVK